MKKSVYFLATTLLISFLFLFSNTLVNDSINGSVNNENLDNVKRVPLTSITESEPNDDAGSADDIGPGWHYGISDNFNQDWYRINVNQGQLLEVTTWYEHNYVHLNTELKNNESNHLMGDEDHIFEDKWDYRKFKHVATYSGWYYIVIHNSWSSGNYDLYVRIRNPEVIFEDDFEDNSLDPQSGGWKDPGDYPSNYWHITTNEAHNGIRSLWCANESSGFYEKTIGTSSVRVSDSITIQNMDLRGYDHINFNFWYKKVTNGSTDEFNIRADISGNQLYLTNRYTDNDFILENNLNERPSFSYYECDLSMFGGYNHVDLTFVFDTQNELFNNYSGVKIDDIKILGFKDNITIGSKLDVSEDDTYIYRIEYLEDRDHADPWLYGPVLGGEPIGIGVPDEWHDDKEEPDHQEVKIEINSIEKMIDYWDINIRITEPDESTNYPVSYEISKNPINFKNSMCFFIPNNDIAGYLMNADNVDGGVFDISFGQHWEDHRNEWIYNIRFRFDDFSINMDYNEKGVLVWYSYHSHMYGKDFFRMHMAYDHEPDWGDDFDPWNAYIEIPGYDVFILLAVLSCASIIIGIRMKKLKIK